MYHKRYLTRTAEEELGADLELGEAIHTYPWGHDVHDRLSHKGLPAKWSEREEEILSEEVPFFSKFH